MNSRFFALGLVIFCLWGCRSYAGKKEDVFRFAVISDLNKSYGSVVYTDNLKRSIEYIVRGDDRKEPVHLVLSTGDMVAGQKAGLNYKKMWESFHKHVTVPLNQSQIPFAPSPGNHDASSSPNFEMERLAYRQTFSNRVPLPHLNQFELLPGSKYPLSYAFVFKYVLFVALDATSIDPLSEEQVSWLAQVLDQNRGLKYKFVFGHVPLYPFAHGRAHEFLGYKDIQAALRLERLLEQYRVDYFISGHHHAYFDGHRQGHVKFVSVPLLGDGARSLLGTSSSSPHGFLLFEVSSTGISMRAIGAQDLVPLDKDILPPTISVPADSSATCLGCATFPWEAFLGDRVLYFRN